MCGEKGRFTTRKRNSAGSPPHVRGKVFACGCCPVLEGITPAYTGKSFWRCKVRPRCRDHPRVCGENALSTFSSRKNSGSPPHMRGKSSSPPWAISPARDHPRVCGEKVSSVLGGYEKAGSPPHMRGKGCVCIPETVIKRITPACAGKSRGWRSIQKVSGDHPRVCGEKSPRPCRP